MLAEVNALLRGEPVNRLDDIDHLGNGHFAGALTEHYDAAIDAGCYSLFLLFGFGHQRGVQVFPVVGVVFIAEPENLVSVAATSSDFEWQCVSTL